MKRIIGVGAVVLGLVTTSILVGPAAHADLPGCNVYPPDAHIVPGRRIDVQYYFECNNPRIRYVKATLSIRRDRDLVPDATVKYYQFDNFRDPRRAGINASLQSDGKCQRGKKYHGDITINVSLNANQKYTKTLRGKSVTCR
jgi:hypothetical protein